MTEVYGPGFYGLVLALLIEGGGDVTAEMAGGGGGARVTEIQGREEWDDQLTGM